MSVSGLKRNAREQMLGKARIFLVGAVYLLICAVLTYLSEHVSGFSDAVEKTHDIVSTGRIPEYADMLLPIRPLGAVIALAIALISPVIDVGFIGCCLKISRGKSASFGDIFDGFALFSKIILIAILQSIFIALWSMLFIIPGIIAAFRYSQSYFILLDNPEKGALECIRESKRLMAGNKLDFFILGLSFIGWVMLDLLVTWYFPLSMPLPIVSLWLTPYLTVTKAGFYNNLIHDKPGQTV